MAEEEFNVLLKLQKDWADDCSVAGYFRKLGDGLMGLFLYWRILLYLVVK